MTQMAKLAKPFPSRYIKQVQGKYGSHVEHGTVNQALLATVGPFDFEVKEIVRGSHIETDKEGKVTKQLADVVVGVVCALTCEIDGRTTRIEEIGDCEKPDNWSNDGARLKDAVSDGLKRAAARIGLGLHLRCGDDYFLHASLTKEESAE